MVGFVNVFEFARLHVGNLFGTSVNGKHVRIGYGMCVAQKCDVWRMHDASWGLGGRVARPRFRRRFEGGWDLYRIYFHLARVSYKRMIVWLIDDDGRWMYGGMECR